MRLTEKDKNGNYYTTGKNIEKVYPKLGQLEDIEDELGIDLITLFRALKQNYVYVKENDLVEKNKGFAINGLALWSQIKLKPEDYGKTWALTKEKLL